MSHCPHRAEPGLNGGRGDIGEGTQSPDPEASEEIALVVTDYDRRNGVLSVTKARVDGIDQDVTKTREDRRVVLCPRAVAILEQHLKCASDGAVQATQVPLGRTRLRSVRGHSMQHVRFAQCGLLDLMDQTFSPDGEYAFCQPVRCLASPSGTLVRSIARAEPAVPKLSVSAGRSASPS